MTTAHLLLEAVRTLETKQAEITVINDEIKAYKKKLRARGFDLHALTQVIKDRKLSEDDRREREGILQIYRAALGLLDGTELGEFARRRLDKKDPPDKPGDDEGDGHDSGSNSPPASSPEPQASPPNLELARQSGRSAAQEGKRVVENPYPAGDPQRAAWDEGWCEEAGNDGMDIPKALQRTKPKKKDDEPKRA